MSNQNNISQIESNLLNLGKMINTQTSQLSTLGNQLEELNLIDYKLIPASERLILDFQIQTLEYKISTGKDRLNNILKLYNLSVLAIKQLTLEDNIAQNPDALSETEKKGCKDRLKELLESVREISDQLK